MARKTAANLSLIPRMQEQIGSKDEWDLLREAYERERTEEVRHLLMNKALRWIDFSQHEWPAGILYGMNGATAAECEELLRDVAFIRTLDDGTNAPFLSVYENRIREYQQRLRQSAG